LTLLLDLLVVRHERQQPVEIGDRAGIFALGNEQLAARKIRSALGLRRLRDGAREILDGVLNVALAAIDLATPVKCVWNIGVEGERRVDLDQR
jgi:hypothetical protein